MIRRIATAAILLAAACGWSSRASAELKPGVAELLEKGAERTAEAERTRQAEEKAAQLSISIEQPEPSAKAERINEARHRFAVSYIGSDQDLLEALAWNSGVAIAAQQCAVAVGGRYFTDSEFADCHEAVVGRDQFHRTRRQAELLVLECLREQLVEIDDYIAGKDHIQPDEPVAGLRESLLRDIVMPCGALTAARMAGFGEDLTAQEFTEILNGVGGR